MSSMSKRLGHYDRSGFEFVQRALGDNVTAAINFDRLQKHPTEGYMIFEVLKCEEEQLVSPYTSHPNRYWHKNYHKFLALWRAAQDFNAKLFLVNYAEAGTRYEDRVLVIEVLDMDECGITREKVTQHTMASFSKWFVALNNQCLEGEENLVLDIYKNKTSAELGSIKLKLGKHQGETLEEIYTTDPSYLSWLSQTNFTYAMAAMCYLEKLGKAPV